MSCPHTVQMLHQLRYRGSSAGLAECKWKGISPLLHRYMYQYVGICKCSNSFLPSHSLVPTSPPSVLTCTQEQKQLCLERLLDLPGHELEHQLGCDSCTVAYIASLYQVLFLLHGIVQSNQIAERLIKTQLWNTDVHTTHTA